MFVTVISTILRRLSTLIQRKGRVHVLPPVLVSMVTVSAMTAMPAAAQRDMDTDVESPVAWGKFQNSFRSCVRTGSDSGSKSWF